MRRHAPIAAVRVPAALLALLVGVSVPALARAGDPSTTPSTPAVATSTTPGTTPTTPAVTTPTTPAELTPAPTPTTSPGPVPAPEVTDDNPDPWALGDSIGARMESRWDPVHGVYMNDKGLPDTRLNALMLQLEAMAALAGHSGPIRHDDRIEATVKVLLQPPVLVTRNLRPRQVGHFPHAPAWTPTIGEDPEQAVLHPSIDTAVVRALTAAWRARSIINMSADTTAGISQILVQLAASPFYAGSSHALNQINWDEEVYSAALEVAGDTAVLPQYRQQLVWFAEHANTPAYAGGSPNLTSGGGFRYLPTRGKTAALNRIETTEYGNLALGSLGMYQAAIRAGMTPLSAADTAVLQKWARHMLLGSWTHAGYPNWDTGLGTHRRHLRQYWAWSLDGMMTASSPDGLLGYPKQRAYVRSIAEHGIALYLATAWNSQTMGVVDGPLPAKTSFDAPNGFSVGSGNELIGPLRFAVLDASLDGRFQNIPAAEPPNWFASDQETGRLAFSTPVYNGAVLSQRGGQSQGGLEPVRLFDGDQRPLTALGGRGTGSLGLSILQGGVVKTDTEPATPSRQTTKDVTLVAKAPNTAASFGKSFETTAYASSLKGRVDVRNKFTTTDIGTIYRLTNLAKKTKIALRVPVWGATSQVAITGGAVFRDGAWHRNSNPLKMTGTTPQGGRFSVVFGGLPRSAQVSIVGVQPDSWRPDGAKQLVVVFNSPSGGTARITRDISVVPS